MKIFGLTIAKEIYMSVIIIVLAIITERILKMIIKKTFNPNKKHKKFDSRKMGTIRSLLSNVVRYGVWVLAILSLLSVFGVNTAALITGLGVVSLVVGLAFQDILKDILVGASILFENWYAVGDLVKIGDFTGTVTSIGLKATRIQAYTGEIKIISNRNITEVINYSLDKTMAVVDIPVSYDANLDKVEKILKVTVANFKDNIPFLTDEPEVWGVEELDSSAVIFRVVAKCEPTKHFEVQRQMKKEIKIALDKNGIKIPYTQIEVHNEK